MIFEEALNINQNKNSGQSLDKLIKKVSSFFSLNKPDSKQVIGRWVENTLQMEVTSTGKLPFGTERTLRIPRG